MFELDARLAADTEVLGDFKLCRVLLMKDANYPWVILVPRRQGATELFQLAPEEQQQLTQESSRVAEAMMTLFGADKMNVAALGNMVPQLHIHHIARFKNDAAWPKPVWGAVPAREYSTDEITQRIASLKKAFAL